MISPINTNISTGSIAYQEELNNLAKQAENVTVQKKDPLKSAHTGCCQDRSGFERYCGK